MLKKTAVAVLSLTASTMASAAMYSPAPEPTCTPGNVTVPCEAKRWDIGIHALYLKPRLDADLDYQVVTTNPPGTVRFHTLGAEWDWGYRLNGSYHFGTGNDVSMDWTHFQDTTTNFFNFAPGVRNTVWMNNQLDQVNLVLGQHIDNGLRHNMRWFAGLQAAQIKNNWNNYFVGPLLGNPNAITLNDIFQDRKFTGIGATFGGDYSYEVGSGFSLTASGQMALLAGSARTDLRVTAPQLFPGIILADFYASKRAIVPELEAKAGVNYAYQSTHGTFNLNAGYQWMNYFNAVQSIRLVGVAPTIVVSDQGYDGTYFGVHWVSNPV